MTSSINPNNIDGAYPVAGQDNNSQGFRDNFTNTKTNFQYAADEITDLQNKAVLKQALTGTTLNNDMLGAVLSNAQLQDMSETRVPLGSLSGTVTVNYAAGSYQTVSTNGNITLAFTNWPAAGALGVVAVQINVTSTAHTVTFPVNSGPTPLTNSTGIVGFNSTTNVVTFATTGIYTFEFSSSDGGTTITVNETNQRLSPFNNSSEDITNTAAANLAVTTTYFTTAGAETATLAAGVAGQIKVFSAVDVTAGNMVVTVTNAGWKASGTGTITFSGRGQSCIMQYTASKWFVIGAGPGAGNTFAQLA
jgi:hypothetical protein